MLEDLSTMPSKRLARELKKLAHDALTCHAVTVFDGNEDDGLAVALHVDSRRRADVLDLARVVEDDSAVHVFSSWSLLLPTRGRSAWHLLLRIEFERPVQCEFTVTIDIQDHPTDSRTTLSLLLAADRLVFVLDGWLDPHWPLVWIAAPTAREPVFELLTASA